MKQEPEIIGNIENQPFIFNQTCLLLKTMNSAFTNAQQEDAFHYLCGANFQSYK